LLEVDLRGTRPDSITLASAAGETPRRPFWSRSIGALNQRQASGLARRRITVSIVRLLVFGGTAWLGRCIVSAAVELGHDVTCLARGASGNPPDGAVFVRGDRSHSAAYKQLATEKWDGVVDVARQPGQVGSAVDALAGRTSLYVFVSSCSVYADHSTGGQTGLATGRCGSRVRRLRTAPCWCPTPPTWRHR
jgi:hypothetical protein